jgi:ParB family chromosome partitioning protein
MPRDMPRLGRGLKSLISIPTLEDDLAPVTPGPASTSTAVPGSTLAVDRIEPNPFQPRKVFNPDKLKELADSIAVSGMIQPVVVRPQGERFQLVAGQRRLQAAVHAGLTAVPVLVREATDEETLRLALAENIHREDLNAIDRAEAYRDYRDRFEASAEQIAMDLGEDRSTIANYIRLLDLPSEIRDLVASNQLSMGHARALLGLPDAHSQVTLGKLAITRSMSVRQLEALVRLRKTTNGPATDDESPAPQQTKRPHVVDLEQRFSRAVGTKVQIKEGRSKGTGRIVIDYYNLDDFDRIADRLGIERE